MSYVSTDLAEAAAGLGSGMTGGAGYALRSGSLGAIGMKNDVADLKAINEYIMGLATGVEQKHDAGSLPNDRYNTWLAQRQDWITFYGNTVQSWWISDEDMNFARLKRDAINKNLDPESFAWVEKTASDKKLAQKPEDAPTPGWYKWAWVGAGVVMVFLLASVAIKTTVKSGIAKVAL